MCVYREHLAMAHEEYRVLLDRRTQLLRDVIDCEDKSMKLLWGVLKRIHAEIDSGKATP
jgi:hypothetical protein